MLKAAETQIAAQPRTLPTAVGSSLAAVVCICADPASSSPPTSVGGKSATDRLLCGAR